MTYLEWRLGFFSSWISQEISAPATLTIAVAKVGFRTVCALLIMMESGSGDSRSQRCGLFWSVPWRLVHLSLHASLYSIPFCVLFFPVLLSWPEMTASFWQWQESFRNFFFFTSHFSATHWLCFLADRDHRSNATETFPGWFVVPRAQRKTLFWSN